MSNCPKLPKYHESKWFQLWGATCTKTTHPTSQPAATIFVLIAKCFHPNCKILCRRLIGKTCQLIKMGLKENTLPHQHRHRINHGHRYHFLCTCAWTLKWSLYFDKVLFNNMIWSCELWNVLCDLLFLSCTEMIALERLFVSVHFFVALQLPRRIEVALIILVELFSCMVPYWAIW